MFKTIANIFRVPELRNKVLFTLMMLAIFRIGHAVPLPGVDQAEFEAKAKKQQDQGQDSAASKLAAYVSIFSGGNLSQSTIFGLGVMPYISASIIFQLLTTVVPQLEKMSKEGESGRRKIQEWTRYASVPIAALQAGFWMKYMASEGMIQSTWSGWSFWIMGISALTAGCIFLMWVGEQIDEYGIGQGISLLIMAGIVSRIPYAVYEVYSQLDLTGNGGAGTMGPGKILFLIASFVFVVAGSILITQAQRRIPVQQAKHTRGRRVYGGQKQYLPLRVNHGGVMPIIFAQSLMLFPSMLFSWLNGTINTGTERGIFGNIIFFLASSFDWGSFLYLMTEVVLIYFFAFFWTTVQFKPKEMAEQLRDYGSFIPGLRPGKRTADYLEKVMFRMTYVGAAFLCIIAVIPTLIASQLSIPFQITAFLGGTGLLIVVSVALDAVQRIETNLLTRNYGGFLGGGEGGKKMKGAQF